MSIQDSLNQMVELKKTIRDLLMEFIKHTVTIASGLLALLIALTPSLQHNNWLFLATLVLLLLCILSGTATLYIVLFQFRKMDKDLLESIKLQVEKQTKNFDPVFAKHNAILKWSEKICLSSFLLACVSLVVFAFLK